MFRLLKLEDRIVLDGAGIVEVLEDVRDEDLDNGLDSNSGDSGFDDADLADLPLSEGPDAADAVSVLVVASDLPDAEMLAGAAKGDVIVLQYDAENLDLSALGGMIDEALEGRTADSIAFATHGGNLPAVKLGEGAITSLDSMEDDAEIREFWSGIGGLVSEGGRIDLLACDVTEDAAAGEAFLAGLEALTGRNVAASADATGNEAYGGNWVLESDGVDVAGTYFQAEALDEYGHQFAGAPEAIGDTPNLSPRETDGRLVYAIQTDQIFTGDNLTFSSSAPPNWADGDGGFGLWFFAPDLYYGRTGGGSGVGTEAGQTYTLTYTATNSLGSDTISFDIVIPDAGEATPRFTQGGYNAGTFPEAPATPAGTEIFDLGLASERLSDTTNTDGFSFRIAAGDPDDALAIDDDGKITVNDPNAFRFEENPSFRLVVEVKDAEGLYGTTFVDLDLQNVLGASVSVKDGADNTIDERTGESTTFVVSLDSATNVGTTVNLAYSGDADAGRYAGTLPTTVTIPAGATSATVQVTAENNNVLEGQENLKVSVLAGTGYAVGAPAAAEIFITDVDAPAVSLSLADGAPGTIDEGASTTIVATLNGEQLTDVTVPLDISGTAVEADYDVAQSSILIPAGSITGTLQVDALTDTDFDEANETVVFEIGAAGFDVTGGPVTVTIQDVSPPVAAIDVSPATIDELEGDSATATVTLDAPADGNTVVNLSYAGAAFEASPSRFDGALPGFVVISAGEQSATFKITAADNSTADGAEPLQVSLAEGTGYRLGADVDAEITVTELGPPTVELSLDAGASAAIDEGQSTTIVATIREAQGQDVTVPLAFDGGTAVASDFSAASSIVIAQGETTGKLTLNAIWDDVEAGEAGEAASETVIVGIDTAAAVGFEAGADATETVTINDVPPLPIAAIARLDAAPSLINEPETDGGAGETATFRVSLDGPAESAFTVSLAYSGAAAADADRYTAPTDVSFNVGDETATFQITSAFTAAEEGLENLVVALAEGADYRLDETDVQSEIFVTDVELPTVTLSGSTTIDEGQTAVVTATIDTPQNSDITVPLDTSSGTAGATDYSVPETFIVIPATQNTGTLVVTALEDTDYEEANETAVFAIDAANAVGFAPAADTATVTIEDVSPPPVTLSLDGNAVVNELTGNATTFTVTLAENAAQDTAISLSFAGAATGADPARFSAPESVTISSGTNSATFQVTPVDNGVVDGAQTLQVSVVDGEGYRPGDPAAAEISVTDAEPPEVSIVALPFRIYENAGAGPTETVVSVSLSAAAQTRSTVDIALSGTADGPDGAAPDYAIDATTVVFEAGDTTIDVTLTALEDDLFDEGAETVVFTLANPDGLVIDETENEDDIVIEESSRPYLSLSTVPEDGTIWEDAGDDAANPDAPLTAAVTLSLSAARAEATAVSLIVDTEAPLAQYTATADGTTVVVSDTQWLVNIPAGSESVDVLVKGVEDAEFNPNYAIGLTVDETSLSGVRPAADAGAANVIIQDNDGPIVSLAAADPVEFAEDGAGNTAAFTVETDTLSSFAFDVLIDVSGAGLLDTADIDGDFEVLSGGVVENGQIKVTIPADAASVTVTLQGIADNLVEGDEDFTLTLVDDAATPVNNDPEANTLAGAVSDTTTAPAGLAVDVISTSEGDEGNARPTFQEFDATGGTPGTATAAVTVTLAAGTELASELPILLTPAADTAPLADAGEDYKLYSDAARTAEIPFEDGAFRLTITPEDQDATDPLKYATEFYIGGVEDALVEGDENFSLTGRIDGLANPSDTQPFRIIDTTEGDPTATLAVEAADASVTEAGGTTTFTLRLQDDAGAAKPVSGPVTVDVTLTGILPTDANGVESAGAVELGTDYTLVLTVPDGDDVTIDAAAFSVVFDEGQTERTLTLTALADAAPFFEGDETVALEGTVAGGNAQNPAEGAPTAQVTIEEASAEPTASLAFADFAGTAAEVGEDAGTLAVRVNLSHESVFPVAVPVAFAAPDGMDPDMVATLVDDYLPPGGAATSEVTVAAGALFKDATVGIVEDELLERDEDFRISIPADDAEIENGLSGTPAELTATILDNDVDGPAKIGLYKTAMDGHTLDTLNEQGTNLVRMDVKVDRTITAPLTVTLEFSGDADFGGEDQDYFIYAGAAPEDAVEGNLINPQPQADGTWVLSDFFGAVDPAPADPIEGARTFSLLLKGNTDGVFEGDEAITVSVVGADGGTNGFGPAEISGTAAQTVTLEDADEAPGVSRFVFEDGIDTILEGGDADTPGTTYVLAELTGVTVGDVVLTLGAKGDAGFSPKIPGQAGQDFSWEAGSGGQITIPAGQTTGRIELSAIADAVFEGEETFDIWVASVTGEEFLAEGAAFPGESEALNLTIQDADEGPEVSLDLGANPAAIQEDGATDQTTTVNITMDTPADSRGATTMFIDIVGDAAINTNDPLGAPPAGDFRLSVAGNEVKAGALSGTFGTADESSYSYADNLLTITWALDDQGTDIPLKFQALDDEDVEGAETIDVKIVSTDSFSSFDNEVDPSVIEITDDDLDELKIGLIAVDDTTEGAGAFGQGRMDIVMEDEAGDETLDVQLDIDLTLSFTPTSDSIAIPGAAEDFTVTFGGESLVFEQVETFDPDDDTTWAWTSEITLAAGTFPGRPRLLFDAPDDSVYEFNELFEVKLEEATAGRGDVVNSPAGANRTVEMTISDPDASKPTVSMARKDGAPETFSEVDGATTMEVELTGPVSVDTDVVITLADQTADGAARFTDGGAAATAQDFKVTEVDADGNPVPDPAGDLTPAAGPTGTFTITIPAGATKAEFKLEGAGEDNFLEDDESIKAEVTEAKATFNDSAGGLLTDGEQVFDSNPDPSNIQVFVSDPGLARPELTLTDPGASFTELDGAGDPNTATFTVNLDAASSFDTRVRLNLGGDATPGEDLTADGVDYIVQIGGNGEYVPDVTAADAVDAAGDPLNDDFADAIAITGLLGSVEGTNDGATTETGEPDIGVANATIWWSWTAPADVEITLDSAGDPDGTPFNTLLGVYTGTAVNDLTVVADTGGTDIDGTAASGTFAATEGETYYFVVDGATGGDVGDIVLTLDARDYALIQDDGGQKYVELNIPAGTEDATVTLKSRGGDGFEPDEPITVTAVDGAIPDGSGNQYSDFFELGATVTQSIDLVNSDALNVSIGVNPGDIYEDAADGPTTANFDLTLRDDDGNPLSSFRDVTATVVFDEANSEALFGDDFTVTGLDPALDVDGNVIEDTYTVLIPAGQEQVLFSVTAVSDGLYEPNAGNPETVQFILDSAEDSEGTLTLVDAAGTPVGTGTATATTAINDGDDPPVLDYALVDDRDGILVPAEVNEGETQFIKVSFQNGVSSSEDTTFSLTFTDGTPPGEANFADYKVDNGTPAATMSFTITANDTEILIPLSAVTDIEYEGPETLEIGPLPDIPSANATWSAERVDDKGTPLVYTDDTLTAESSDTVTLVDQTAAPTVFFKFLDGTTSLTLDTDLLEGQGDLLDVDGATGTFKVAMSAASFQEEIVRVRLAGDVTVGAATTNDLSIQVDGTDVTGTGTFDVSIPATGTEQTIDVTINNPDGIYFPDRNFTLEIVDVENEDVDGNRIDSPVEPGGTDEFGNDGITQLDFTIADDDDPYVVALSVNADELAENGGKVSVKASLFDPNNDFAPVAAAGDIQVTLDPAFSGFDPATADFGAGNDFTVDGAADPVVLTIPAGDSDSGFQAAYLSLGDTEYEGNEIFTPNIADIDVAAEAFVADYTGPTDLETWAATTAVALGDLYVPDANANGHYYRATVAGTTDTAEPGTWPTDGGTVTDGGVTWRDMGRVIQEWTAADTVAVGSLYYPTDANANGHYYRATVGGETAGTEPATWTTNGGTVTDNTVTWIDMGLAPVVSIIDANDGPTVDISVAKPTFTEEGGVNTATLTLTGASPVDEVVYVSAGGTATPRPSEAAEDIPTHDYEVLTATTGGEDVEFIPDFELEDGTTTGVWAVTVPAGVTSHDFFFVGIGDNPDGRYYEPAPNETIEMEIVDFVNPLQFGSTVTASTALVDDDFNFAPFLAFGDPLEESVLEDDPGAFTLPTPTLTQDANGDTIVVLDIGGTATLGDFVLTPDTHTPVDGDDYWIQVQNLNVTLNPLEEPGKYEVIIPDGEVAPLKINVVGDGVYEGDETVIVTIEEVKAGARIDAEAQTYTLTIDDEADEAVLKLEADTSGIPDAVDFNDDQVPEEPQEFTGPEDGRVVSSGQFFKITKTGETAEPQTLRIEVADLAAVNELTPSPLAGSITEENISEVTPVYGVDYTIDGFTQDADGTWFYLMDVGVGSATPEEFFLPTVRILSDDIDEGTATLDLEYVALKITEIAFGEKAAVPEPVGTVDENTDYTGVLQIMDIDETPVAGTGDFTAYNPDDPAANPLDRDSFDEGATVQVTTADLAAEDGDTPDAGVLFEIVVPTEFGTLFIDENDNGIWDEGVDTQLVAPPAEGETLGPNEADVFTLADIKAGDLRYSHYSGQGSAAMEELEDFFQFELTDGTNKAVDAVTDVDGDEDTQGFQPYTMTFTADNVDDPPVAFNDVFWIVEGNSGQLFTSEADALAAAGDPAVIATDSDGDALVGGAGLSEIVSGNADAAFVLFAENDGEMELRLQLPLVREGVAARILTVDITDETGSVDLTRTFFVNVLEDGEPSFTSNPIPDATWETSEGAFIYSFDPGQAFPNPDSKILFLSDSTANPEWLNFEPSTNTFWALPGEGVPAVGSSLPVTIFADFYDEVTGEKLNVDPVESGFELTIAALEEAELLDALDYLEEGETEMLPEEEAVPVQAMIAAADETLDDAALYADALALLEDEAAA